MRCITTTLLCLHHDLDNNLLPNTEYLICTRFRVFPWYRPDIPRTFVLSTFYTIEPSIYTNHLERYIFHCNRLVDQLAQPFFLCIEVHMRVPMFTLVQRLPLHDE